jgi:hypothetical protein
MAGSALRCNYPPRHRTLADDHHAHHVPLLTSTISSSSFIRPLPCTTTYTSSGALPVVTLLAVGFAVSVDVLLTEQWDAHQPIFSASSTMIPAGPRT